ncbi:hypothetical protein BD779DRAFT_1480094 [Infundibulicybe gibba]|nr:hypothetical protein BD779DRAFT_1480094 [Infundibulicybe gibba]
MPVDIKTLSKSSIKTTIETQMVTLGPGRAEEMRLKSYFGFPQYALNLLTRLLRSAWHTYFWRCMKSTKNLSPDIGIEEGTLLPPTKPRLWIFYGSIYNIISFSREDGKPVLSKSPQYRSTTRITGILENGLPTMPGHSAVQRQVLCLAEGLSAVLEGGYGDRASSSLIGTGVCQCIEATHPATRRSHLNISGRFLRISASSTAACGRHLSRLANSPPLAHLSRGMVLDIESPSW